MSSKYEAISFHAKPQRKSNPLTYPQVFSGIEDLYPPCQKPNASKNQFILPFASLRLCVSKKNDRSSTVSRQAAKPAKKTKPIHPSLSRLCVSHTRLHRHLPVPGLLRCLWSISIVYDFSQERPHESTGTPSLRTFLLAMTPKSGQCSGNGRNDDIPRKTSNGSWTSTSIPERIENGCSSPTMLVIMESIGSS